MEQQQSGTEYREDELIAYLALSFTKGIGAIIARQLISQFGTAAEVFRQRKVHLERIPGVGKERAAAILKRDFFGAAERELLIARKRRIRIITLPDPLYPRRLRQCVDAPVVLFFHGNGDLNPQRVVAIVGTRHITEYGRQQVLSLISVLKEHDVAVVSGMAYGIDIAAHREAVRLELPTIGVLAHGLDRLYPAAHRSTAEKMLGTGGLLTEYPSGTKPDRDNFPARNRIVAGMCDATIVVESAARGGALITAEFANDYNRDVFAFPGRTGDLYSFGCNELIRSNKAMLAQNGKQLVAEMRWLTTTGTSRQLPLFTELNDEQSKIAGFLQGRETAHLDDIAWQCGIPVSRTSALLLELEFKGLVKALPGKSFGLILR